MWCHCNDQQVLSSRSLYICNKPVLSSLLWLRTIPRHFQPGCISEVLRDVLNGAEELGYIPYNVDLELICFKIYMTAWENDQSTHCFMLNVELLKAPFKIRYVSHSHIGGFVVVYGPKCNVSALLLLRWKIDYQLLYHFVDGIQNWQTHTPGPIKKSFWSMP